MKKSITKKIAVLFLLLGLTPLFVVMLFSIEQTVLRHKMKERLERDHHQVVVLPANQVNWVSDDEIIINEVMFDICCFTFDKGVYTFTGQFDEEETSLAKKIDEASGASDDENKFLSQFFKWDLNNYNSDNESSIVRLNSHDFISYRSPYLPNLFKRVFSPPPDIRSMFFS